MTGVPETVPRRVWVLTTTGDRLVSRTDQMAPEQLVEMMRMFESAINTRQPGISFQTDDGFAHIRMEQLVAVGMEEPKATPKVKRRRHDPDPGE